MRKKQSLKKKDTICVYHDYVHPVPVKGKKMRLLNELLIFRN